MLANPFKAKKIPPPPPKKKKKKYQIIFHPVPTASIRRPLPYNYWPVIAVLKQCADGMTTV